MAGKLDALVNSVGKAKCDRCGFYFPVEELVEEEQTGLVVDQKCLDKTSFEDDKRGEGSTPVEHHFTT
jgi:hypothetical protein